LVDIRLKQYPEQLTYTLGVSTSLNTNTTFQPFGTYEGSDLDYFGLGSQFRSIPGAVPKMLGTPTLAQGRLYSNQFRDIWNVQTQTAPPNFGMHFSIGTNFGNGGVSLSGVYRTDYYQRWNEIAQLYANGGVDPETGKVKLIPFGNLTFDNSMFKTRLAGVLTSGWNLTPTDKV